MRNFKRIVSIGAAAMLAACGDSSSGGGGGGTPPAIDVRYTGPTASIAIDSTAELGAVVGSNAGGSLVAGSAGGATAMGVMGGASQASARLALDTFARVRRDAGVTATGATVPQEVDCAGGGTVVMTTTEATPGVTTVGDGFQLDFRACKDEMGGSMTGSIGIAVTQTDGEPFLDFPELATPGQPYGVTLSFADWALVDPSGYFTGFDGDLTMTQLFPSGDGWLTETITGTSIVFASGLNGAIQWAFRMSGPKAGGGFEISAGEHLTGGYPDAVASGFTARLCSTDIGGCVEVVSNPPFEIWDPDLYPSTGTMRFSDDAGNFVEVTATNGATGAITVYYDIGAGTAGPFFTTWLCLDSVDSSGCFVP